MNSDVAVVHCVAFTYSYRLQTARFTPFQSDSVVKYDIIKYIKYISCVLRYRIMQSVAKGDFNI